MSAEKLASPKPPLSAISSSAAAAATGVEDWDTMSLLKTYGIPLGAVALCGAGAVYLAKRMNDLETRVSAMKRDNVRHLSETDVRLIVQQMQRDGLIQVNASVPQIAPPPVPMQPKQVVPPPSKVQLPTAAQQQEYQQYLYYQQNQPPVNSTQETPSSLATAWTPKARVALVETQTQ